VNDSGDWYDPPHFMWSSGKADNKAQWNTSFQAGAERQIINKGDIFGLG